MSGSPDPKSKIRNPKLENGDGTAGGFDLLAGRGAEGMGRDVERDADLAAAQDLDEVLLAHDAGAGQRFGRHRLRGVEVTLLDEPGQARHVDGPVLDAVRALEAELGQAPLQRHLAAFEPDRDAAAR